MTLPAGLFSSDAANRLAQPFQWTARASSIEDDPSRYVIDDPGLESAINAALILGHPLLLTGEAGTGKTTLAERIAWQLHLEKPLKFETKSTSRSTDLFYTFDALGRFQASHSGTTGEPALKYLTYNALGLAILYSNPPDHVRSLLPPGKTHPGQRRSVVLIDEIDKAHRDFPNDLLNELDRMFFRIPELDNREIKAEAAMRPIVVITSNSEKNLPDPFLRRCVYYHISFPNERTLRRILTNLLPKLAATPDSPMLDSALGFFLELREQSLKKKPSTAELVNWVTILLTFDAQLDRGLQAQPALLRGSLPALVKNQEDMAEIQNFNSKFFNTAGHA